MRFQFSFNTKNEIIFVNEKPYLFSIGTLIKMFIDINWSDIIDEIRLMPDNLSFEKSENLNLVESHLKKYIFHPVLMKPLLKNKSRDELINSLKEFQQTYEIILHIFEALIDEEKGNYPELLFDLLYIKEPDILSKHFLNTKEARMMSFSERVIPVYSDTDGFSFLFEADDIRTILFQELQFLCNNNFIVRKCAYCQRFFWTRRTQQIYCDRIDNGTGKSCAQIGPTQKCLSNRSEAYQLYWRYRTKLFNRKSKTSNNEQFQLWLQRTAPYRDRAKKNDITLDEMTLALNRIENEVYYKFV